MRIVVQERFDKAWISNRECGEDGSMSQRMRLFILILIINLGMVLIYLIWNHIRRKEKLGSVWMKAVMMLLCPVVGPMFYFACVFFL